MRAWINGVLQDSAPTGTASGDLSGTYPSPVVAAVRGGIAIPQNEGLPVRVGFVLWQDSATQAGQITADFSNMRIYDGGIGISAL